MNPQTKNVAELEAETKAKLEAEIRSKLEAEFDDKLDAEMKAKEKTRSKRHPELRTDLIEVEYNTGYIAMVTPAVAEVFRKKIQSPQYGTMRIVRVGK